MTVELHNEYQSIVMNRSPPHGRKRLSSKLRDPHDTTRVVDVSCASISFVQSPGFGARAPSEASTAKNETTGGLMGGQYGHGP